MAATCSRCGEKLGLLQRLSGLCTKCSGTARQEKHEAEQAYGAALDELVLDGAFADRMIQRLPVLANQAGFTLAKRQGLNLQALRDYLDDVLEDESLTLDEEDRLSEVMRALEIDQSVFNSTLSQYLHRLVIARVNDGRLPVLPTPHIMLKRGEECHLETNASLLKEVAIREYRGGYSGFSFRVMKGVTYHTGSSRGHSVVVGTKIEIEDTGILSVTSQRAVFLGNKRTIECAYSKLVNLNIFDDGITFHVTNRKSATTLQVQSGLGHVIAAVVNGACQQT